MNNIANYLMTSYNNSIKLPQIMFNNYLSDQLQVIIVMLAGQFYMMAHCRAGTLLM